MTPTAVAPARGSSSLSSALPSMLQQANMATQTEWSCSTCCNAEDDVAYMTPCLHQFCLGCPVWWAKRKPECPLCRQAVNTIIYSMEQRTIFWTWLFNTPQSHWLPATRMSRGLWGQCPGLMCLASSPRSEQAFSRTAWRSMSPCCPG